MKTLKRPKSSQLQGCDTLVSRAMVGNICGVRQGIWGARVSMAGLVEDTNAACHLGQGSRRAYLHSYLYPRRPNPCPYHLWRQCSVRCASVHWPVIYRGRLHRPSGVSPIYQSGHTVDSSTGISHIHKRISYSSSLICALSKHNLLFGDEMCKKWVVVWIKSLKCI